MENIELSPSKVVTLTKLQYESFLTKLSDDTYEPTSLELATEYSFQEYKFFIVRRYAMNHVVYYD